MIEEIIYSPIDGGNVFFGNIIIDKSHPCLFKVKMGDFLFPDKECGVSSEHWGMEGYVLHFNSSSKETMENNMKLIKEQLEILKEEVLEKFVIFEKFNEINKREYGNSKW